MNCSFNIFLFQITSQNPYAEVFVGKPFVQTVDIKNLTEVEEALRDIRNAKVIIFVLSRTVRILLGVKTQMQTKNSKCIVEVICQLPCCVKRFTTKIRLYFLTHPFYLPRGRVKKSHDHNVTFNGTQYMRTRKIQKKYINNKNSQNINVQSRHTLQVQFWSMASDE